MRRDLISLPAAFALIAAFATTGWSAGRGDAISDPAQAGPDFALQGEYVGQVEADGHKIGCGVQVIALGDGQFRGVAYVGGLPGAGWDGRERLTLEGQSQADGATVFKIVDGVETAELANGTFTMFNREGQTIGTLKKTERTSPTLGAKPPAGAVVLFDGTSPDAFQGGRMTDDGLLIEGATSKQKFQDFTLHLEFRTPFVPHARGQGRGNSGFYAQGRYEVQILDSFGLEGKDNECGGIYEIASPKVNMCFPPLSWQTYDVDFTAAAHEGGKKVNSARMTVRHNGVVIHDDLEIPRATRAAPVRESAQPGPVYLQNHGNPVRFRNIWVVPKP